VNDPQPTGYISLRRAFETYNDTWPEPSEIAEKQKLTDEHLAQFKYAMAHDQLRASVRYPDRQGEFEVPPHLWSVEGFTELEILHDAVPTHAPPEWSSYVGRTLFVRESSFRQWLDHNGWQPLPNPKDFDDPASMPTWTIPMVCAWIGTTDIERVRWQMSAWRRAHGWPDASLALLAVGQMIDEDDDEDDPAHFDSQDAYKRLASAGENGDILATAMSSETGQPVQLKPSDWTYGQLEFGNGLDERLRVGSVVFSRITFRRTEVQSLWRNEALSTLSQTGAPGRPSSMYVVLEEFERRARLSPPEVVQSVGKQADILHDWFTANHKGLPPLTPKTIENRIRDRHREVSPRK
jgi:hypothetical protein